MKTVRIFLLLLLILSMSACARHVPDTGDEATLKAPVSATAQEATSAPALPVEDNSLDDYDDYSPEEVAIANDPLEGWNRFWFHTNDWFLRKVVKPVHKGYAFIMPAPMRSGISNFAYNLTFPVRMINFLFQGEFAQAGVEFDRSLVNFMVSLGFADVASQSKPRFEYHPEVATFDSTLATWGVPDGPYFMIPFLGPSTVRGAVGFGGDLALKPQDYVLDWPVTLGSSVFFGFNSADKLYEPYEQLTGAALEPYTALRNAYMSKRFQLQEER